MAKADVEATLDHLVNAAVPRRDVHGVILVGSHGRGSADEFSDIDVVILCDDPGHLVEDEDWWRSLGPVLMTYSDSYGDDADRRLVLEDGSDIELIFEPMSWFESDHAARTLSFGYRILYGPDAPQIAVAPRRSPPDLEATVSRFWYRAWWSARKLHRGEIVMAARMINGTLHTLLLDVLAEANESRSPGHVDRRRVDTWLDESTRARLSACAAGYDASSVREAIRSTTALFSDAVGRCSAQDGTPLQHETAQVGAWIANLLAPQEPGALGPA